MAESNFVMDKKALVKDKTNFVMDEKEFVMAKSNFVLDKTNFVMVKKEFFIAGVGHRTHRVPSNLEKKMPSKETQIYEVELQTNEVRKVHHAIG